MMYSIFNEEPAPLSDLRPDIPGGFQNVVSRCLEKDPWKRYPDTGAFRDALESLVGVQGATRTSPRPAGPESPAGRGRFRWPVMLAVTAVVAAAIVIGYPRWTGRSDRPADRQMTKVAVLFFENLGPGDDAYFADGITDAITARLARIQELGVISRQSTVKYKSSDKSIRQIGDELGADYVLEGTIQRERPGDPSSRVRIIPQLIRVADDIHVWADTYDEDMSQVFRLQSEIAERVATALNITLLDRERELVGAQPTDNIEAYEYYLRANEQFYYERFNWEDAQRSIDNYRRAVELDPGFAAAWAGMSRAYVWMYYSYGPFEENRSRAAAAAQKATELAPETPETRIALGYYHYYGNRDFAEAVQQFEAALERAPNDALILQALALVERRRGRWERSNELLRRSRELDPRNVNNLWDLSINYSYLRRYEDAEYCLQRLVELEPGSVLGYAELAKLYLLWHGNGERATEVLQTMPQRTSNLSWIVNSTEVPTLVRLDPGYFAELASDGALESLPISDTLAYYVTLAEVYSGIGDSVTAAAYYDSAAKALEIRGASRFPANEHAAYYCFAYAALGRREEAIDCVETALREIPIASDAVLGPGVATAAARLLVRVGKYDRALDLLEAVMSVPAQMSAALLRNDPSWDPLRDSPRFRALVDADR
jgi:serine/threonine-protein kinase